MLPSFLGSLSEGAVEHSETEGVIGFPRRCVGRGAAWALPREKLSSTAKP